MKFMCPVCGYDQLSRPPKNYHICPCCGTEFGHDDLEVSHTTLRSEWISRGMGWFSRKSLPPVGWSPVLQLLKAGNGYDLSSAKQSNVSSVIIAMGSQATAWTTGPIRIIRQSEPIRANQNTSKEVLLRPCLP